jgi:hypothetical protein
MNLRELLKSLHAVDEKHLDMDVMVSPASGGYAGISHVSVLYVGHAVIHLAEPKPQGPPPDLWESQEGAVSVVKPDDLKKVWQFGAMSLTGGPKLGWLKILKPSARNCNCNDSVRSNILNRERSTFSKPLVREILRPAFPN